ncbi:hypothetical protein BZG36_01724 [Bifiguratus adelaidae]|uniref:C3H1-type domain-containing protein n=1 Tax=Bifiguratus adelaidae TaxID=1938954 RepID=A0A261Y4N6_9FUNG|nr:hypothetical protein BZG36_01724 [Bifiguratus adelaidae]
MDTATSLLALLEKKREQRRKEQDALLLEKLAKERQALGMDKKGLEEGEMKPLDHGLPIEDTLPADAAMSTQEQQDVQGEAAPLPTSYLERLDGFIIPPLPRMETVPKTMSASAVDDSFNILRLRYLLNLLLKQNCSHGADQIERENRSLIQRIKQSQQEIMRLSRTVAVARRELEQNLDALEAKLDTSLGPVYANRWRLLKALYVRNGGVDPAAVREFNKVIQTDDRVYYRNTLSKKMPYPIPSGGEHCFPYQFGACPLKPPSCHGLHRCMLCDGHHAADECAATLDSACPPEALMALRIDHHGRHDKDSETRQYSNTPPKPAKHASRAPVVPGVCRSFNNHRQCPEPYCPFRHECFRCGRGHPLSECKDNGHPRTSAKHSSPSLTEKPCASSRPHVSLPSQDTPTATPYTKDPEQVAPPPTQAWPMMGVDDISRLVSSVVESTVTALMRSGFSPSTDNAQASPQVAESLVEPFHTPSPSRDLRFRPAATTRAQNHRYEPYARPAQGTL